MDRELEYVEACDLCGSPSNQARPLFTKRGLSIVKCSGCGLFYVNPRVPQEVLWQRLSHDYFVDEYLPQSGEYDEQANYCFQTPRLLALNGHVPARGRLLDVGCATGLFLAAARVDGWEVMGNELSPFAADYARQHFNVPVAVGNFETLDLPPGSFDAVTMWEAIEHFRSPKAAMRKAAELVRPGGILVLSTPNMAGVSFWFLRDRWWLIGPEEHLFLFTPKTIDHLLGQTGFEVRSLQTAVVDYYYLFHTLVGRTVMPLHIRMAEGGAAQEAMDRDTRSGSRVSTIWSKLKPRLLDPIGRIIHRRNWADTLVVWAGRRE